MIRQCTHKCELWMWIVNIWVHFIKVYMDIFGIILQFSNYQLTLWVRIPLIRCALDTTLCNNVCQWLAICDVLHKLRFPQLNRHDMAEILSKVAITLTLTNYQRFSVLFCCDLVFFWYLTSMVTWVASLWSWLHQY